MLQEQVLLHLLQVHGDANYGSATKIPGGFGTYTIDPASNWVFTTSSSSTLINGLPALYGNIFVYKQGSVLAGATTITID